MDKLASDQGLESKQEEAVLKIRELESRLNDEIKTAAGLGLEVHVNQVSITAYNTTCPQVKLVIKKEL